MQFYHSHSLQVASLHSGFSLSVFRSKIREINHTPIPSEFGLATTLSAKFLNLDTVRSPAPQF